jgi:hypothetical protein
MHHKWKELIDMLCKKPMEIIGDELWTESPIELKDKFSYMLNFHFAL